MQQKKLKKNFKKKKKKTKPALSWNTWLLFTLDRLAISCTQGNNSLQRYNKVIADKFREQCQLNSNRTCFIT